MQRNARLGTLAIIGAAGLALTGCAGPAPADADSPGDGRVSVVAVTDVYGSIAETIGGDAVDVTSIISGSAQDPHEYEATARDQLAVSQAQLVIVNGGGYDDFMTRLLESSSAVVVHASEASGLMPEDADAAAADDEHAHEHEAEHAEPADAEEHDHADDADDHAGHQHIEGFNEHVWYSIHAIEHIAEAITAELLALAPADAAQLQAGSAAFLAELDQLHDRVHALEHDLGGGDVVSTEPVAAYLLEDLGLHDATPPAFASAIESGTGVSARILNDVLRSLEESDIRLLVVNPQSAGPEAELVRETAETAGVPVVELAETLPADTDFLGWMAANLDALEHALR